MGASVGSAGRARRFPGWHRAGGRTALPRPVHVLRRLGLAVAAVVAVAGGGYVGYVGATGSQDAVHPIRKPLCATPADFGWAYEAINYDIAGDAVLATERDKDHCTRFGPPAGADVVTADGIRVAGWYVPSADGDGPRVPTIVLVHGWATNKSDLLRYAATLHPEFNVVLFDQRNSGQSSGDTTTVGAREWQELVAILDWLARTKGPVRVGVLGDSGGGAAALQAVRRGAAVDALVLDSVHSRFMNPLGRKLEQLGHPAIPGSWAIYVAGWLRTGVNLADYEPVDAIPALGSRPTLFIHGTNDVDDVPAANVEVNYAAALAAGVPAELEWCVGGTHGQNPNACPADYPGWVTQFFARALGRSD
jgi:pimeloyl-ACP methyl ester carboxylesterase